ncbi:hypothetical protein ABZ801_01325 [Actinomadura sp. NPDC047616]|uniref:hypothetical protein n=1 Tax=Actinomadura sp. NPDC047616 TaxID=3155914 RepID=UPI0033C674F7
MGGVLEPTPAMGPYGVEVRRESFYLGGPSGRMVVETERWSVPQDDVSAVFAALEQVVSHRAYREAGLNGQGRPFEVSRADDRVTVVGPGALYPCDHDEPCPYSTVELEYRDVSELMRALQEAGT